MYFEEGFTFRNFLVNALQCSYSSTVLVFVVWFWPLISVFMDVFRRIEVSGWAKAIWVIGLIIFPFVGVLAI